MKIDGRTSLEALGLPKNPFGEAIDEFFAEGDRSRQLDELRHLARWSRRLLAVTGERGVGKSTLYRALSNKLDPGVKAARINANLTSDTREVLAGIIQGFGMAAPANADPRLLIELISLHVQEQIDSSRYCLVLIDDAHLLELRALEQLLKLVDAGAQEGLRIVFFAEAYFVQSLDKASKRSDQGQNWHEIRLSPFTDDESRRYVEFRLAAAGHEGRSPFTPNQLSVIVGGSSGLPGRIDELASAILTGQLRVNDDRRWLPRMHRALAVLVLIGAGMGWLIFYNYGETPNANYGETPNAPPLTRATTDAAPAQSTRAGAHAEPVVTGDKSTLALAVPTPNPPNDSTPPRDGGPNTAVANAVIAPIAAAETSPTAPRPSEDAPRDPKPSVASNEPTSKPSQPVAQTSTATVTETPQAATSKSQSMKADSQNLAASKSEAVSTAKPTTAKPMAAQKASLPSAESERKPTVAAAPLDAGGGKPQTVQWLRRQPGQYFTLQLFATTSRAKRDAFVKQQEHPDRFATFETNRDGEPWYAVTYGAYATQAEAKSAAAALPTSVGKVQPWIRTFASVQATLE